MSEFDVIIVGGGLSGLTAAYHLRKKVPELDLLIIESNQTVGGRIKSIPLKVSNNQFCTYDLGGQWISSNQKHILQLIKDLNIQIQPQYDCGCKVSEMIKGQIKRHQTTLPPLNLFARIELNNFITKIEELSRQISLEDPFVLSNVEILDSTSMETYVYRNVRSQIVRNIINLIIKTTCGLRMSEISVLYYIIFTNGTDTIQNQFFCIDGGARQFWIKGGAYEICDQLVKYINRRSIMRNDPVTKININKDESVIVETKSKKQIKANYVIIAIPPKSISKIEFIPNLLPKRMLTYVNSKGGSLIKFIITYKEAFWRRKGYSGEILSHEGPILLTYDITYRNHPAITGLAKSELIDRNLKKCFTIQLSRYWGHEALDVVSFTYYLWSGLEAPMFVPQFLNTGPYCDCRKSVPPIYWAGTETATDWNGYMNGAVQAGARAALEILLRFRPQAMEWRDFNYISRKKRMPPRTMTTDSILKVIGNASFYIFVTIGLYIACSHFLSKRK